MPKVEDEFTQNQYHSVGVYEYNMKNYIGHGAFAMVYKGRYKDNPAKFVAIKTIEKKNLNKSQNLLNKEINILSELTELHHVNVVALLDCQDTPLNVCLVMEYCNGGDLGDYLQAKGTLSEDTIRVFLVQLAEAMKALHEKGIVHRDLKPQNILLSHDGSNPRPQPQDYTLKIADFGFARFLQDGVMAATLCGSPMYMAPEVIMSMKYDAKADLWSLGTIVFQCLVGHAPFQATSPQALRSLYEKNIKLAPKIPNGTSPELFELLSQLLKRNAKDRLNFEQFYNHKFLNRASEKAPSAILQEEITMPEFGSMYAKVNRRTSSPPVKIQSPPRSQPESPRSTRIALSSSPEDDYVIVPSNIPYDQSMESIEKDKPAFQMPPPSPPKVPSPTRPTYLQISEPIPVPTSRDAVYKPVQKPTDAQAQSATKTSTPPGSSIPRSQPISMRRPERPMQTEIDISSLSPPSVQFVIGTPPSGRRRSTSSSLCDTPPPPNTWTVSPVAKNFPMSSPLRFSGTSPPLFSGPLARVPILSSPNLSDNNNLGQSPVIPFCTRAVTLPDISEMGNYHPLFDNVDDEESITFLAPELPEETLLQREHNETLAKINFVLALSNCVLDLAAQRAIPISALVDPSNANQPMNDTRRRTEQLVLLVRALQLLSSGLALASKQLRAGQLQPSKTVTNVVSTLNTKFRSTLTECKQLNGTGLLTKASATHITADTILYNHAIQMCQSAALDELFGKPEECFARYQTAQILLHSLSQQVKNLQDRVLLTKYKNAVERRLYLLHERGYVLAEPSLLSPPSPNSNI